MMHLRLTFIILFIGHTLTAQIKIGLPLGLADSSAVLDLSNAGGSFNKGFLLPQVNLSSSIVWGLLGTIVTDGMVVYNKATAGSGTTAVLPGLYFWAGGKWTIISPATASSASFPYCSSAAFYPAPSTGVLYSNTSYTASYSLGYTNGSGAAYNSIAQTVNGLTLTRTAGSYAAGGGNVVYNLSGTYTGSTNGTVPFIIVECGSTVNYGTAGSPDYVRAALNSSGPVYDAAASGIWIPVTAAEYTNAQSTVASTSIIGESNSLMTNTGGGWSAGYMLTNQNISLPANNYLYGFSFKSGSGATGSTNYSSLSIGLSSTNLSGTYYNFPAGVAIPSITTVTANTQYYFLFKKQTSTVGYVGYLSIFHGFTQLVTNYSSGNTDYYGSMSGTIPNATATASGNNPGEVLIQFLATPTKQW